MMNGFGKRRAYFSPLVFAATGGMGTTVTAVFRKLAFMLAAASAWGCMQGQSIQPGVKI